MGAFTLSLDWPSILVSVLGVAVTYGMLLQRVQALEKRADATDSMFATLIRIEERLKNLEKSFYDATRHTK